MGDFHLVGDGPDDVGADVAFVVEGFEPSPDASPVVGCEGWGFGGVVFVVATAAHVVFFEPLLDFDNAGAVVELVGCVGGLGGDVADLADEGYLFFGGEVSGVRREGWGEGGGLLGLFRRRRWRSRHLGGVVALGALALWLRVGGYLCHMCPGEEVVSWRNIE